MYISPGVRMKMSLIINEIALVILISIDNEVTIIVLNKIKILTDVNDYPTVSLIGVSRASSFSSDSFSQKSLIITNPIIFFYNIFGAINLLVRKQYYC